MRPNGLPGRGMASGAAMAAYMFFAAGCGDGLGGWFGDGVEDANTFPPGAISGVLSYHGSEGIGETHNIRIRWQAIDPGNAVVRGEFSVTVSYSELDAGYSYTIQPITPGHWGPSAVWWDLDDDGVNDSGPEPNLDWGPMSGSLAVRPGETSYQDLKLRD